MRFYIKLFSPHIAIGILALAVFSLTACSQKPKAYGFVINKVEVSQGYQVLHVSVSQDLRLSQQAREALLKGVMLTIRVDMELRNDNKMIVVKRDTRRYQLRYLPLSERYQLASSSPERLQTYLRLRHALAAMGELHIQLFTGPLPSGGYELRARTQIDESRLPAPMRLPAWFSSQWQHNSGWSVWPFDVSV